MILCSEFITVMFKGSSTIRCRKDVSAGRIEVNKYFLQSFTIFQWLTCRFGSFPALNESRYYWSLCYYLGNRSELLYAYLFSFSFPFNFDSNDSNVRWNNEYEFFEIIHIVITICRLTIIALVTCRGSSSLTPHAHKPWATINLYFCAPYHFRQFAKVSWFIIGASERNSPMLNSYVLQSSSEVLCEAFVPLSSNYASAGSTDPTGQEVLHCWCSDDVSVLHPSSKYINAAICPIPTS